MYITGEAITEENEPSLNCENEYRVESLHIPVSLIVAHRDCQSNFCSLLQLFDRQWHLLLDSDREIIP